MGNDKIKIEGLKRKRRRMKLKVKPTNDPSQKQTNEAVIEKFNA